MGLRRHYAPTGECAADGCANPVKLHHRRKFCSSACYHASGHQGRTWSSKPCAHCGERYTPKSPKQLWCWTCLGEPRRYDNGALKYPGEKLLQVYGVSWPEWQAMVARHDGHCWICRDRPAHMLDHDHATGKPRGALCARCNTLLYRAIDSGWLKNATEYLSAAGQSF